MPKVLDGIRVVDLTRVISGPFCTMLLADMGAEVLKIEGPEGEDARNGAPRGRGGSLYWISHNRNKKSITLNLRAEKGKEILRELVKRADIVAENFRPGVMASIGFDYPRLKAIKDDIILVSLCGFGQTGPYAQRPAYDQVIQSMSGLVWVTGHPDGPPARPGVYIGDYLPAVYAAFGTMLALYHRDHTGQGQHVDVAMLDAIVSMMCMPIANYIVNGIASERRGNRSVLNPAAPNNTYRLADGYVHLIVIIDDHFRRLCEALGRQDWLEDPRFKDQFSREKYGAELDALVAAELAPRSVGEVLAMMERAGVACGPVQDIPQVVADPQVQSRQMIVEVDHPVMGRIPVPGVTVKLSATPGEVRTAPPLLGAHDEEVYQGLLGYSHADIEALRADGII
ncbi:MAG: CoA transferase [Bacteroidetes bacterium]|nr:CoA transferase [Bacteroidota bacterium]MCL5026915.1 CoA transferase [Chloroflexota bacterium]